MSPFRQEYFVLWPGDAEKWLVPLRLKEMLQLQLPCLVALEPLSLYAEVFPWLDPRHSAMEFPAGCAWAFRGAIEGRTNEVG